MQPDKSKLTADQRTQLETYEQNQSQIQALEDIASMTHELVNILDDQKKDPKVDHLGTLLVDIRESLNALTNKEAAETPDYAKPVVEAVSRLEKALSASIKAIDVKPQVSVTAPQVNVPSVDLGGVEKILKDLPKAFETAINLLPKTEIPKPDYQPLLQAWEGISEQLLSIENATRLKPLPGSMKVTNLDDVTAQLQILNTQYDNFQFDADDVTPNYIGFNENVDASDDSVDWVIYKLTYSGTAVTSLKKKTGKWSNRTSLFS